jgi:curli biogenesis system outer membrane secretion channel CsgG
MKNRKYFILTLMVFSFLGISVLAHTQVIPPKAKGTSQGGPSIDQVQREDAMGPKARVAVTKFEDKSAKGHYTGRIGDGMAEMLSNALFSTNRFIVVERQSLKDVIKEQDLGASGRVRQDTAAPIGELEGAELLIQGTITEFEPGASGAGGGVGGFIPTQHRWVAGALGGGVKTSHVAMIVKVIDVRTGRILASEQVEGKATDIGGIGGAGGYHLAGTFGAYSKTPMEKAIRVAIDESVKLIVAKTPPEYYRATAPPPQQALPSSSSPQVSPGAATATQPSGKSSGSDSAIVYVKWPSVSLREGPGTNYKATLEVKKGTPLAILEDKGQWLRVSLEDGQEGWIGKGTISEKP